jgi:hypothetical protein
MIHDSDSIWLLISVVWAGVLVTALLLGSLFSVILSLVKSGPGDFCPRWGRFFCLPPQSSSVARRRFAEKKQDRSPAPDDEAFSSGQRNGFETKTRLDSPAQNGGHL